MGNDIQMDITLEEREALRSLAKLTRAAKKSGVASSKAFGIADIALGSFIGSLGSRALSRGLSLLNQGLADTVTNAREFSKGIGEINSLLPKTQQLTEEITNSFLEFSSQFNQELASQTRGFYDIVSAGVKGTTNQLEALRVSNKAAVAGISDVATSADVLTSSFNVFNKQGETFQSLSDQMFETVRLGKTRFDLLASSLGNVIAIAGSVGIKFSELSGTIAFLTKAGISTETAIIGIRQVLSAIIKPTSEAEKLLSKLSLDMSVGAVRAKGFAAVLKDVAVATKGNEKTLSTLFGNVRALLPILAIVKGDFKDFTSILDQVKNSTGATDLAFAKLQETFDFQVGRFLKQIKRVSLVVFNVFIPALTEGFMALNSFMDTINFETVIKNIALVGKAINWLLIVPIVRTTRSIVALVSVWKVLIETMGVMFETSRKTDSALKKWRSNIKDAAASVANVFGPIGENSFSKFIEGLEKKAPDIQATMVRTREMLKNLSFQMGQDVVLGLAGGVNSASEEVNPFDAILNSLSSFEQSLLSGFDRAATGAEERLKQMAKNVKQFSQRIKNSLMSGIATASANAFAAFGAAVAKGEDPIKAFIGSFLASMGQMAIQLGAMFILEGAAMTFAGLPNGPALMAAGAALAAFGGIMSVAFPGGGGASGAGAGGGAGLAAGGGDGLDFAPGGTELTEEDEAEEKRPQINLTIMGDVFDSEKTGLRIANILEEVTDNGIVVRGGV